ncbi:hypothetical protein B566_EDAN007931, partial [Ephemera danica]
MLFPFHVSFLCGKSNTNMALNITVKVHPVVLFQIVDSFERRNADSSRVIGTLLEYQLVCLVEIMETCSPRFQWKLHVMNQKLLVLCSKTQGLSKRAVEPMQELAQVSEAAHKLLGMLDMVLAYVSDVLNNRSTTPPDNAVGRALLDMVHSVPKMSPEEFENMLNSNIKVEAELVYAAELRDLNQRVNTQEAVVGWWATGNEVTRHSSLIHDYYTIECPNSIHLTLDTTLQ